MEPFSEADAAAVVEETSDVSLEEDEFHEEDPADFDEATPPEAAPSIPLRAAPSTPLRAAPSTPLRAAPSTALRAVPSGSTSSQPRSTSIDDGDGGRSTQTCHQDIRMFATVEDRRDVKRRAFQEVRRQLVEDHIEAALLLESVDTDDYGMATFANLAEVSEA
ncbi:unnamed protein product, partial [Symbiodinium sp. CCMP2592]